LVANHEHVLFDFAQGARDYSAELRVLLAAEAMRSHRDEIVLAAGGANELAGVVLLLGDDASVLAQSHVAARLRSAVVARGAIWIESNESRQPPLAAIHLAHNLLVVDPFEELPRYADTGALAAQRELIEEAVGNELQPLLDQLVVDLSLALDLVLRLELRGESSFELSKPDVVEARGIHVIAGDAAAGRVADFDGALERPIGVWRVVYGNEDFPIWHNSVLGRAGVA
jgi:hypothetical protein